MPKRCEIVNNGEPCSYLSQDGTCLLPRTELAEKCPTRETVQNEHKDTWMV